MKRGMLAVAFVLILGGAAARLWNRWREESADRRLALLADWSEVRDAAARQNTSDHELLNRLQSAGANALLVGPSTIQDYLWRDMIFENRALAETVLRQLEDRGVLGVALERTAARKFKLVRAAPGWEPVKDVELGFNPEFIGLAREAGFHLVLRVNNDPWLSSEKFFADLSQITSAEEDLGFLLNTDEVPGGNESLPAWVSLIERQGYVQLLFEFHPAKSAVKMAALSPQSTYRAHTIPSAELKDLTVGAERLRWYRAVQERSCRFLLFHLSPNDSVTSYLESLYRMRQDFTQHGWEMAWPKARRTWSYPSFLQRQVNPLLALFVAIISPVFALRLGLHGNPWKSIGVIFLVTFAGACVMAALSDNPLARIEVVPFRGVKLAFVLAWAGSFLFLYSWEEIRRELSRSVRRMDVIFGLFVAAGAAYLILRTGNAGAGWKVGWEQGLRDQLEYCLVARPRFKEFAIGYPLLLWGLHRGPVRGRLLIGTGMIGPISMVNTFCHLHSPLYLAFWRSANGFLLGVLVGLGLLAIKRCRS